VNATRVPVAPSAALQISILHVPDCPSIGRVRDAVEVALARVGATAVVEEIEGDYPSPTLLIDGVEIDGYPLRSDPACRIELPTHEEITAAVLAAIARRATVVEANGDSE
jgi:hypothetical protein